MLSRSKTGIASATQLMRAQPGIDYRANVRVKWISGSAAALRLDFLDATFAPLSGVVAPPRTSTVFSFVSTSLAVSPPGTAYVRVTLLGDGAVGGEGTSYFDDVRLSAL